MTREEVASIKPGTEILVRMTVKDNAVGGRVVLSETSNGINGYVRPEDIHSIVPPKPLVIGDRVKDADGHTSVLMGISGDLAWVRFDDDNYDHCAMFLDRLTRITDAPK